MQAEIEAKFVDVDIDNIRAKLEELGATLEQPMRDMRRALIEEEQHAAENSFIRIRDEGDKVTIAYKRHPKNFADATIDGAREIETTIGDFDAAVTIFAASGWHYTTYQESRRETWRLDDAEIVIDEWPWIKPFIEIEGESEQIVRAAAEKLGFDWSDAVFGDVTQAYRAEYPDLPTDEGFNICRLPIIKFDMPLPELLKGV